jgi:hypothetical protein
MPQFSVKNPGLLKITDGPIEYKGATQDWYLKFWQRMAGCGPTNASHLARYLAESRRGCEAFVDEPAGTKDGFRKLMNVVWKYVTPGYRGVNGTNLLVQGMRRYAEDRGFRMTFRVMDITIETYRRPSEEELSDFMKRAMEKDRPVAFLNLNNGEERNLDRWHWVTLVAFNTDTMTAVMYDQTKSRAIDLALWLRTTTLGGGFVAADVYPIAETGDEEITI